MRQGGQSLARRARSDAPNLSRHNRVETECFKSITYDALLKRGKVNLICVHRGQSCWRCFAVVRTVTALARGGRGW